MTDSSDATDATGAADALRTIAASFLPYRDPLTRRRVRRNARKLVAPGPWAAAKASNNEVAQLAMLRLLWLQREARRAANHRMFEAVALLARSAIDTCIVGMFCLAAPDAAERMNKLNAQHLKGMTEYLTISVIDRQVRDDMVMLLDEPKRDPNIFAMVTAIDDAFGDETAEMLYRAYYTSLSTLYAHGGGVALLRHVNKDKITERPAKYWSIRSALHIVDSSVGLLSARLATATGLPAARYQRYHDAHRKRTVTPLTNMGLRAGIDAINWRGAREVVRAGRELHAYVQSDEASHDDINTRERNVRHFTTRMLNALGTTPDPKASAIAIDGIVKRALSTLADAQATNKK